jgi:glutaredoxin-like protein NrdH
MSRIVGYFPCQVNEPDAARPAQPEGDGMDQPKVFLYALSTCGHCRNAKKLLDEHGVRYDFIDVDLLPREELKKVLEDVAKYNPQRSFPTILIGDQIIVGDRELEILEALGL